MSFSDESRDAAWRAYVLASDVQVSEEDVRNELAYIELDMRHRMQYDRLTGGEMHVFPGVELQERAEELAEVAHFEAKAPRVVKRIVAEQGLTVTPEELEAEAERVAERQGATMDMVRMFFGEDFGMLRDDVLERKAIDWAVSQG